MDLLTGSITVPLGAATPVTVIVFRLTADRSLPLIQKR
jgi:hypothetical protein